MLRQNLLIFGGILAMLFGLIFALQGGGVITAPADSVMVGNRDWVTRGIVLFVLGAIFAAGARMVPTKAERKAARRAERSAERAEHEAE